MSGPAREVLEESDLAALDALPVCVALVDYAGPEPRNLWANKAHLKTVGCSLEEFVAHVPAASEGEASMWEHWYHEIQQCGNDMCQRIFVERFKGHEKISAEALFKPSTVRFKGELTSCVLLTLWPLDVKDPKVVETSYYSALLETSPYPLCFFSLDGHLITCNPAARQVFGETIWLQSDIFGMGERERRGLNLDDIPITGGSFRIERTERRTAYESMMDALSETGRYEVDLPMKRKAPDGSEISWYCRVLALRHKDPVTGYPILMISHQDVTALRNVEGELGRIQMKEETNKGLMAHDSDVAGSLLTLLGEDWETDTRRTRESASEMAEASAGEMAQVLSADTAHLSSMGSNKLSTLRSLLDKADDWHFDVFELERETDGQPLQVLGWHVICSRGLIDELNLDHIKLINFLREIEAGHLDNPYHNGTHVADVVQSMHVMLSKGGLGLHLGRIETLAALLAACVHDFEHRGFNNDFLIKTQDDWAIDSNDKSPNESHHLSAAFRVLRNRDCNFLWRMDAGAQQQIRKIMIELVLATDMAEHMAIVSRIKTDIQKRLESPDDAIGEQFPESLHILALQGAIKVADIGHLYAPKEVHIKWSERLEEEMWLQGDVEKQRNMKVSFLMDRDKPGVTKSQPGFVDFVVRPLFDTWVACFPGCKVVQENLEANYQYWKSKEESKAR